MAQRVSWSFKATFCRRTTQVTRVWYGEREELALDNELAVVGWEEVPDLLTFGTGDDLYAALESANPQDGRGTLLNWKGQLWTFSRDFQIRVWDAGDLVRELQNNYSKLPKDVQAELPLKQIWIVAPDEDEE